MDTLLISWVGAARQPTHDTTWIEMAQCLYGFDRRTAERLAFVRGLWDAGRIGEE